ncbi:MAG: 4Fe-4S dicluster domain-containing protein [Sulfurospirillaceae bacterium]|jgi:DMSO reductase iron-sulfur subunit|nr:4Fe-4S dicluster domain-containing protein [Sulfurospirillaceae bacterium]MCK9546060.1 4Fe-4S dicluster domain-containing protein [Sulfurospirillaceae bacterium]MDY0237253.1 4Fe-4S dicluster domain-containing protein [Campylobacterales bacterium]NLM99969.1 4Fe-4S dicluster domain-containing protein [Campylobacteraceae bacterium]
MQKAFLVDSSLCLGCNTCAMACKNQYHQDNGIAWRRVREVGHEEYLEDENNILPELSWYAKAPMVDMPAERFYFSLACNHCEEPACVAICPAGAQTKDPLTGIVKQDQSMCIGCGGCVKACPFGASKFNTKLGKAEKCSMCWERQEEGLLPACVQSCPVEALKIIDIHDPKYANIGVANPVGIDYAIDAYTKPSTRFILPSLPEKMHRLKG